MDKLSKIFLWLAVISFAVCAWDPWTPSLDSLTLEQAYIASIEHRGNTTTITFKAESGSTFICVSGRKSLGCKPHVFESAYEGKANLRIWHDDVKVYQVMNSDEMLFSYQASYIPPRLLSVVLALLFSLPLLVDWGRKIGIVNR